MKQGKIIRKGKSKGKQLYNLYICLIVMRLHIYNVKIHRVIGVLTPSEAMSVVTRKRAARETSLLHKDQAYSWIMQFFTSIYILWYLPIKINQKWIKSYNTSVLSMLNLLWIDYAMYGTVVNAITICTQLYYHKQSRNMWMVVDMSHVFNVSFNGSADWSNECQLIKI